MGNPRERGFATRAIHGAPDARAPRGPVAPPIHQTATFYFETAEEFADVIQEKREGYVYTRLDNPTHTALHEIVADLERAEAAYSFASGMAAIHAAITTLARSGEHIVAHKGLYGGTFGLMSKIVPRYGIEVTLVDATQPGNVAAALRPNTRIVYVETICNPTLDVLGMARMADVAHAGGAALVVDNTFATPYLCNPIALGADVVVHSATKYLGGHGDLVAGLVAGSRERVAAIRESNIDVGGICSPLHAWLIVRGLKTLALRMERHCQNAAAVAAFLEGRSEVERVYYPGLASHPQHELARHQLRGFGGMVAFELNGGVEAGRRFLDSLKLCLRAASLGDAHTLIAHPASTTHRQLDSEQRRRAGIADGLVRISVGIEDVEDIIADLEQALAA